MNPLVEKTVIELGYESIDKFFHQKLIEGVQQKIDKFTKEVVEFEKKYNMKFPQFQKEYLLKEGDEVFEKDDDGMEWEWNVRAIQELNKKLELLKNARYTLTIL
jgi:hypothetical protein